jgi:hypothetical protein
MNTIKHLACSLAASATPIGGSERDGAAVISLTTH